MHRSITLEVARQHLKNLDEKTGSAHIDNRKGDKLAPRTEFFRLFQKIVLRNAGQQDPAFIENTNQASAFVADCLNEAKKTYVHAS
jgi:hypothetical protein